MKKIFTLIFATICLNTAQAGLYLEPYLGYAFGSSENESQGGATATTEHSYTSTYLGARVGYGMMGWSGGLDYSFTMADYDIKISNPAGVSSSDEFKNKTWGLFANYNFPALPLRAWGTYFIDWQRENKKSNTMSNVGDTDSGSGFGLGVGFTGLPFVSINVELRKISIGESKDNSSGVTTSYPTTSQQKPDYKEILLSVSAPFDF